MMNKWLIWSLVSLVVFFSISGYFFSSYISREISISPTPTGELVINNALVNSFEMLSPPNNPSLVLLNVRGELADPCTQIYETKKNLVDQTFYITITSAKPHDAYCERTSASFEETIEIDFSGLESGAYLININGISQEFTYTLEE